MASVQTPTMTMICVSENIYRDINISLFNFIHKCFFQPLRPELLRCNAFLSRYVLPDPRRLNKHGWLSPKPFNNGKFQESKGSFRRNYFAKSSYKWTRCLDTETCNEPKKQVNPDVVVPAAQKNQISLKPSVNLHNFFANPISVTR